MTQVADTQLMLPTHELDIIRHLVCESEVIRRLLTMADAMAKAGIPVLLTGEGGSGKSLLARYIHARSPNRAGACVNFRCAEMSAEDVQMRLLGRTRSTGGLLAEAGGGTLVVDGMNELTSSGQRELLRLLPSIHNSGNGKVRLLSTAGRGKGAARRPFFEALGAILSEGIIRVPPLRERPEDLPGLLQLALQDANAVLGTRVTGFSRGALELLGQYAFPGNVRELGIIVNQAVAVARHETIFAEDIRIAEGEDGESGMGSDRLESLAEVEKHHIWRVLLRTGWKRTAAARVLQITPAFLDRKIRIYGLEREQ